MDAQPAKQEEAGQKLDAILDLMRKWNYWDFFTFYHYLAWQLFLSVMLINNFFACIHYVFLESFMQYIYWFLILNAYILLFFLDDKRGVRIYNFIPSYQYIAEIQAIVIPSKLHDRDTLVLFIKQFSALFYFVANVLQLFC